MTGAYRRLSQCRICGGELRVFLSLGESPLANAFIAPDRANAVEHRFPLETARCADCSLVQLTVVVDPEIMFRDYVYASSASSPLLAHFDDLAASVARDFAPRGSLVVEFGSNDGILLRSLGSRGLRALGVEPASNLAARANAEGLETLNEFFGPDVVGRIRDERGPASAVLGNNVLAHIDDLGSVVQALDRLLGDDGVFIAEVPYLPDLLEHVEYDTIYHEHLSYFHLAPLQRLFTAAGFELFDVVRLPIHGGSVRIHVARTGRRAPTSRLRELLGSEQRSGLRTEALYGEFAARVQRQRTELVALLGRLKSEGARLAGYGATAKGNTMLNYCGIDTSVLDYIADTTPYKHGLLTPGMHIPVVAEAKLKEDRPNFILLLAWNYADAIVPRYRDYLEAGGRFIHPIPLARVIGP